MMPLNQVATVSAPGTAHAQRAGVGPRERRAQVEKGIAQARLGLNPITDGQTIRLPIPDLTEERRKELAKLAGQYAEKAKIAIRNVRRDGMEHAQGRREEEGNHARTTASAPRTRSRS